MAFDNLNGLKLITPPTVEPVTLAQAKNHLRVDIADDDALIGTYITTAREACEAFIHGYIINQTWKVALNAFPTDASPILVPIEPLQSVTSFTWEDQTGVVTTMNAWNGTTGDYILDTDHEPGRLVLPPNQVWPGNSLWPVSPIQITVVAGFGADGTKCPQSYVNGMLLCIGHWYENRETVNNTGAVGKEVPMSAEYCWWAGGRYWHLR